MPLRHLLLCYGHCAMKHYSVIREKGKAPAASMLPGQRLLFHFCPFASHEGGACAVMVNPEAGFGLTFHPAEEISEALVLCCRICCRLSGFFFHLFDLEKELAANPFRPGDLLGRSRESGQSPLFRPFCRLVLLFCLVAARAETIFFEPCDFSFAL